MVTLDADERSVWRLQALIALRKELPQLVTSAYEPVAAQVTSCSIGGEAMVGQSSSR